MGFCENIYSEYDLGSWRISLLKKKYKFLGDRPCIQIWKQKPVGTFSLKWSFL